MLGTMQMPVCDHPKRARMACVPAAFLLPFLLFVTAGAEVCTTQAHLSEAQRHEIGAAALTLASAVQAGDAARVQASTVPAYVGEPGQAAYLVRNTAQHIAADTLAVTQVYLLDATGRKAADATEADFTCPLSGTADETDFAISGLPAGRFAFAMVEARGADPWLLSFLMEAEGGSSGGAWRMAGFYPHPRTAAGHDGLWYWTAARADAKADRPWLAWLRYDQAERLLRPANFVSTGNLDKLQSEQRAAAPQALSNGINEQTALSLQGEHGAVYSITGLRTQASDDGKQLNLVVQLPADAALASDAQTERNGAVARSFLIAHPELRSGFSNILVIAERSGAEPVLTEKPIDQVGK